MRALSSSPSSRAPAAAVDDALRLLEALALVGDVDLLGLDAVLDEHEGMVGVHLQIALALGIALYVVLALVEPQLGVGP